MLRLWIEDCCWANLPGRSSGCCFKHHIHTTINTNLQLQSIYLISSQIRRYLLEGNAGCDEGINFWMCFYSHTGPGGDWVKAPAPDARYCPAVKPLWVLEPVHGKQRAWMLPAPSPALQVHHPSLSCLAHSPFQEQKTLSLHGSTTGGMYIACPPVNWFLIKMSTFNAILMSQFWQNVSFMQ